MEQVGRAQLRLIRETITKRQVVRADRARPAALCEEDGEKEGSNRTKITLFEEVPAAELPFLQKFAMMVVRTERTTPRVAMGKTRVKTSLKPVLYPPKWN